MPISGLTISAFAAAFRAGNNDAIAMSIEVDGPSDAVHAVPDGLFRNNLEVALYATDASGKVKDGAHDVVTVALKPQNARC